MDSPKRYDLEDRTSLFARRVRAFVKHLPRTLGNLEDCRQAIRSSGSVGANYIEANEALGKKDFLMHVKICRKEAKETRYWIELIDVADNTELAREQQGLARESVELMSIFGAILRKVE